MGFRSEEETIPVGGPAMDRGGRQTGTSLYIDIPEFFLLIPRQSNTAYSVMSGGSKLAALSLTYPYQVVRSRIQVRPVAFI
jgi:hypothetical protein